MPRCLVAALTTVSAFACTESSAPLEATPSAETPTATHETSTVDESVNRPVSGDTEQANRLFELAITREKMGRRAEARQFYEQSLEADPAHLPTLISFGYFLLQNVEHLNQGRALRLFRQARLLDENDVRSLCGEAISRQTLADNEKAAPLLKACLARPDLPTPSPPRSLAELSYANLLFEAGNVDEADQHYQRALAGASARHSARYCVDYGTFCIAQGRNEQAEQLMREAIRRNPTHVSAHYHLYRLLHVRGAEEEATKERRIHEILRQMSDHTSRFYNDDVDRNLRLRRELVEAYPEYERARFDLVRECLDRRRYPDALTELAAMVGEGGTAEAFYLLARTYAGLGQIEEANKAATTMRKLNPKVPEAVLDDILEEWTKNHSVNDKALQRTLADWKKTTAP